MPKSLTQKQAYDQCKRDGMYLPQVEINSAKVESMLVIVKEDLLTIAELKKKDRWNTLYKLSYDVLHTLVEAFLIFDSMKSANHQCLFAYLCEKHSELDFHWDFFEKVRTKRNGIQYYGSQVKKGDWKEVEMQFSLTINELKKQITKKLRQ